MVNTKTMHASSDAKLCRIVSQGRFGNSILLGYSEGARGGRSFDSLYICDQVKSCFCFKFIISKEKLRHKCYTDQQKIPKILTVSSTNI